MTDKLLILDMDGVVTHSHYARYRDIDPRCLDLVIRLCKETGAKIIINSTWGRYGFERFKTKLIACGGEALLQYLIDLSDLATIVPEANETPGLSMVRHLEKHDLQGASTTLLSTVICGYIQ